MDRHSIAVAFLIALGIIVGINILGMAFKLMISQLQSRRTRQLKRFREENAYKRCIIEIEKREVK